MEYKSLVTIQVTSVATLESVFEIVFPFENYQMKVPETCKFHSIFNFNIVIKWNHLDFFFFLAHVSKWWVFQTM